MHTYLISAKLYKISKNAVINKEKFVLTVNRF